MTLRRSLSSLAGFALVLAACTPTPDPEAQPSTLPTPSVASPSPTPSTSDAPDEPATTSAAPDVEDADEDLEPTFTPEPTDEVQQQDALTHAEGTLAVFWDTGAGQDGWYEGLRATMTPQGAEPFAYTAIENIAPGEVTGTGTVEFVDNGATALVTVPSDQGDWTLTLHRTDGGWLTDAITFPNGEE